MENKDGVYLWFQFFKNKVTPDLDDAIMEDDDAADNGDISLDIGNSFYRRMYTNSCNGSYFFSFPFPDWHKICHHFYIEVDPEEGLITFGSPTPCSPVEDMDDSDNPVSYFLAKLKFNYKAGYLLNGDIYYPTFITENSETSLVLSPILSLK